MLSPETLADLNLKATLEARANRRLPWIPESAEDARGIARPDTAARIPSFGDYVPEGWEPVADDDGDPVLYFVDTSGFGSPSEPALTLDQFARALERDWEPGYGYAVTESGQFQAYVGVFRPLPRCSECRQPQGGRHGGGCGKRVLGAPLVVAEDCTSDD